MTFDEATARYHAAADDLHRAILAELPDRVRKFLPAATEARLRTAHNEDGNLRTEVFAVRVDAAWVDGDVAGPPAAWDAMYDDLFDMLEFYADIQGEVGFAEVDFAPLPVSA